MGWALLLWHPRQIIPHCHSAVHPTACARHAPCLLSCHPTQPVSHPGPPPPPPPPPCPPQEHPHITHDQVATTSALKHALSALEDLQQMARLAKLLYRGQLSDMRVGSSSDAPVDRSQSLLSLLAGELRAACNVVVCATLY